MARITKSPRSALGVFILGRGSFSKISAVEGIRLPHDAEETFVEFDQKKLSPQARREVLTGKFGGKR